MQLIGLIAAEHPGVLLAPREHTEGISGTPEGSASILAVLRQLVKQVKSFYGVEEATIERITDSPGASGHALYQVLPVLSGSKEEVRSDMKTLAAELVETLRQHAASLRH